MAAYSRTDSMVNFLNSSDGLKWGNNILVQINIRICFCSPKLPQQPTRLISWLLIAENGNYMVGNFDGKKFENLTSFNKLIMEKWWGFADFQRF